MLTTLTATLTLLALARQPAPPAEQVDAQRLMALLRELPEKRAGMGRVEHWEGLKQTEELLASRLTELGYAPRFEDVPWRPPFHRNEAPDAPAHDPPVFRNVIAERTGADLPAEVLIVAAHMDAVPRAPGADDNGTGVAAVLEIARVLHDHPTRRTIRYIFFTLEECGLVGSTRYVMNTRADWAAGKEKIVGMMSLDMLGYYSDQPDSQKSPIPPVPGVFEPPTVADFIGMAGILKHREFSQRLNAEMLAAAPGLKSVVVDFLPIAPPDLLRSDHAPFLLAGQPAVILSDTANFRSPHYHKATDTIDTIDVERFGLVVKGLAGAVYAIAERAIEPGRE